MFHHESWKSAFWSQKVKGQDHEAQKQCRRGLLHSFECWLFLVLCVTAPCCSYRLSWIPVIAMYFEHKVYTAHCDTFYGIWTTSYPHMPIGKVRIYRLLFLCVFVCLFVRLRISPPRIKLAVSNFARRFIDVHGRESHILGNFAPLEAQNRTNRPERALNYK